jgi:hypothetical protein
MNNFKDGLEKDTPEENGKAVKKTKHRKHRHTRKEEQPTVKDDSSVNYSAETTPVAEKPKKEKKKKALWWVDQKEVEKDIIVKKQEFLHQRQEELSRLKELIRVEYQQQNNKVADEVTNILLRFIEFLVACTQDGKTAETYHLSGGRLPRTYWRHYANCRPQSDEYRVHIH